MSTAGWGAPTQVRGLARATSLNLVGSAAAALSTLAILLVLTKGMGQATAGMFLSAVALFQVLSIAASLGVETGLVKWISARVDPSTRIMDRELLRVALIPVVTISVLFAVLTLLLSGKIGSFIGGEDLVLEATAIVSTMAWFIPPASVAYALLGATRGYGTMRPTVALDRLGRSVIQVSGVALAVGIGADPEIIALVWALPYVLLLILAGVWLSRIQNSDRILAQTPIGWINAAARFWSFTAPRAVASIFRATFQWFDVVLVAGLASPEDAAVYAVATRLLQIGLLAAFSVGQAVEPRFGKSIAENDQRTTRSLYAITTGWLIILTWPLYILLALFAGSVLGVFGHGYVAGTTTVVVLSGAVMLGAGVGPVDILLVMAGKSLWSLWNTGAALGLNLVLNFVLIPTLGILGAAISLAVSRATANLLPLAQLNHLAGFHPFGDIWVRAALTSVVIFGGVGLTMKLAFGAGISTAVIAAVIATAMYLPVLWRSRTLIGLDPKVIFPGRATA